MKFFLNISRQWLAFRRWLAFARIVCLFLVHAGFAHEVLASPAPAGIAIRVSATATYNPAGVAQTENANSNIVSATVEAVEAAVLTQSQTVTRPPGSNVVLSHMLVNTGNVASAYSIDLSNGGPGCAAGSLSMGALRLLRDMNNNGVSDAADVVLPTATPGAVLLMPGESMALLVQGNLPLAPTGSSCIALVVTSALQKLVISNQDIVVIGQSAVLLLSKTASYGGVVVPGQTRIDFAVNAVNIGSQDARPTNLMAPVLSALTVNGAPSNLVIVRDSIPTGTRYVPGSLRTTAANAMLLYRRPGDPAFAFQTVEDPNAVEVALGVSTPVVTNASIAMQFAVTVLGNHSGDIRNTAQGHYFDGLVSAVAPSNTVVIASNVARVGVAKQASNPITNHGTDGAPDGTVTARFHVHVRNYGTAWLYGVQATDLLEGSAPEKFGTYTTATVPGPNQYTIVPGSILITGNPNATANAGFTGAGSAQTLFAPDVVLAPGMGVTAQFDVRVNINGRTVPLANVVKAAAATGPGGTPSVFDDSSNGNNPDPDDDGDPTNNSSTTFLATQVPVLSLVKTASLPRRTGQGIYLIDYTFRVSNSGRGPAPNVRVIDNLNCTFETDAAGGGVASWELVGPPRLRNGNLALSPTFTGRAPCNRSKAASSDPFDLPTELVLNLTDGSRSLAPGQSEEISLTVQVTVKPTTGGPGTTVSNKAWAAAFDQNTVGFDPAAVSAATTSTVQSLLIDPQGVVYDAAARLPIAGAIVTYTRQSCGNGMAGPIAAAELFGSTSGAYSFNTNGSVSMTTGPDGAYQFFLKSPPVDSLCTYGVAVTPPAGSAFVTPSELLPAAPGTYAACGAVVANAAAPKGSDSTLYYRSVSAGVTTSGAACEAVHNHIPMDPGNIRGLLLRKEGSKRQAELGDFMDYALTVTNKTGGALTGFEFNDRLPVGFAYVPGSARLDGAAIENPTGGNGPELSFNYPALLLNTDASATVRYRVRIGVGAPTNGDAVNRASVHAGPLRSNIASWTVRISGGVFSDEAFAFGKVYMDCKRDGRQAGVDEVGIPGVRLYMENGTFVITDVEGKWSLYGLRPVTHALRVDQTTLPPGAKLEILDNRNSGNPASRFVDLVKGEFHKADFIVGNCDDKAVMANVAARRSAIVANGDVELDAQLRSRLNPEGKSPVIGDGRGLPASGQTSGTGSTGLLTPGTRPLIALPAILSSTQTNSFVGGAGRGGGTLNTAGASAIAPAGSLFSPISGVPSAAQPSSINGNSAASPGSLHTRPLTHSGSMLEPWALPTLPQAKPSPIDLEAVLPTLTDNALGFLDLKDGDTVSGQSINIRVKGEWGIALQLTVNDQVQDQKRVGKRATLADSRLEAWEYIGISLKAGKNKLTVAATDGFGNNRGPSSTLYVIAPDRLGAVQIDVPTAARADLTTPIPVTVRLVDAAGVPITARTQITLESDRGRWLNEDLNAREPGVQAFMDGGQAEFHLLPPGEPGNLRIRVSADLFVQEASVALLPELRPMIGIGVAEGVFDFTKRGRLPLGAMPAGAAFESELSQLGGDSSARRASARAAFFFKGAVKGEYLLTAAFDSDKTQKDRLFRDIRPDEFYPVYGDSSVKGFDAQSTQKLYVRIDKNRSYLLYGDFTTASSTEVRSLSQTNRTLTGLKNVYDDERMRATTYVSRTSQTQQIEEFRALGTSGPYYLSGNSGGFVDNSEQIEVVVRDRNQPNVVLQRTPVVRFVDYTVESLTRRVLFTHPISSVDANLNPQSIRITYEVDSGGEKFTVAGADVQFKASDRLQVGVVASTDRNTANQRDLGALTALGRLGDNTTVAAELVRTQSDENGQGSGARLEIRHQDEKLAVVGLASKTSASFDNPGASFTAGHSDASARLEYKVDPTIALRAEALYSKDALLTQDRKGATFSLQKKVSDTVTVETGIRHGQSTTTLGSSSGFDYGKASTYNGGMGSNLSAGNTTALGAAAAANGIKDDLTTVRARVSAQVPGLKGAQAFIEGEQDLADSHRHTVAIGANYALTDKTRAYGRYEVISSLYGPYALGSTQINNTGIIGIESAYMEGGRVYNEYRLADSIDGRSAAAAVGVRNTFQVTPRVRLTGGIEHTRNLSGASNSVSNGTGYNGPLGESTAITGGAEYMTDTLKASGILEARNGSDATTRLFSAGVGYKVSREISVLARSVVSESTGQGAGAGNERDLQRHQVGVAYRPVDTNVWNALARFEHKTEKVLGTGTASGSALNSGSVFGNSSGNAALPGKYTADIVSAHLNVNPQAGTQLTSRYAVKFSKADDGILSSTYWAQLLQGRLTQDINKDWDIGMQLGVLYGKGGGLQKTAGAELGYQVYRDIWVSGGYNFVGLTDRDLTANEYTSKGPYVRMRMKFDETALGFPAAGSGPVKPAIEAMVVPESMTRLPDAPQLELAPLLMPLPPIETGQKEVRAAAR